MRASGRGEAARACEDVLLNAGGSAGNISSSFFSDLVSAWHRLLLYAWVLSTFDQFYELFRLLLLPDAWVLRPVRGDSLVFAWVLRGTT